MSKWIITACCVVAWCPLSESAFSSERSTDVDSEKKHADRFLNLLRRRPSFGTALERLRSFHVERGTLDKLVGELRGVPSKQPDAAVLHLIAGMLQVQHGQGAEAVPLLEDVERRRIADPVASQALALALRSAGEVSGSIAAFERALEKQPTKPDRRTIYKDLARLHHRRGNTDQSLKVLQQLESEFPDDRAVREDVARRLQDDGQLQQALERWQSLATDATSPDQRVQYRLSIADIQVNMGHADKARQTLETELSQIRPDSWLDDVIHRKLESVLFSSQGRRGVIQYYRDRLVEHPDDVVSVTRLATLLANLGQLEDASSIYLTAIRKLPSSVKLRAALIDLLVAQGKISEAVKFGRELLHLQGAGSSEYELVGRLLLRDTTIEKTERERQASRVWMMICGDGRNASTLAHSARLHRQAGLLEQAITLFRKLTRLAPETSTWQEELGETLYELGDREAALREWNAIAAGSRRNTHNLTRVSEILERAGEPVAALQLMQQACELQPEIRDRVRLAGLLREAGQHDAAYVELNRAADLAISPVDRRIIIEAKTETWKQDPLLHVQVSKLQADLQQNSDNADTWLQLALIFQIDQRLADAVRSIERATTIDAQSVPAWQAACEIFAAAGLLDRAAAANRQLADLSPANRTTALQQVVHLEQQLGRTTKAMQAAELLVTESPGHPESCRQFADICFAVGHDTVALDCLQRCQRLNPDDDQLSIELAELLAERFQSADATALLWRSFDRADTLDRRLILIDALIKLSKETDTFDRVMERLSSVSSLDPVERSLCIASAWMLVEEPVRAEETLVQASLQFGRDQRILKMQVELAESQNQLELAARYQRQLTALSTAVEDHVRLADLQFRTGQLGESELSWIRDARSGNDTTAALRSIDQFLDGGRVEAAELMCQRLASDRPGDWRVLYRLAVIQWRLGHKDQAVVTLQQIIDLDLPLDHVLEAAQPKAVPIRSSVRVNSLRQQSIQVIRAAALSPLARRASQIVETLNWLQLYTGDELYSQTLTAPIDYGAARSAAVGLLWLHQDVQGRTAMAAGLAAADRVNDRQVTDWCAVAMTARRSIQTAHPAQMPDGVRLDELMDLLAGSNEVEHQLVMVGLRCGSGVFRSSTTRQPTASAEDNTAMKILAAAETVAVERPEWLRDIGGWPAVLRHLKQDDHSLDLAEVIARLSNSLQPATLVSATDLAFATGDPHAVALCIRRCLPLRSQIQIRKSLESRRKDLSALALQLSAKQNWRPVQQMIDLLLELQAARYVPITGSDSSQFAGYRLEPNDSQTSTGAPTKPLPPEDSREFALDSKNRVRLVKRFKVSGNAVRQAWKTLEDAGTLIDYELGLLLYHLTAAEDAEHRFQAVLAHLEKTTSDQNERNRIPAALALAQIYAIHEQHDECMLQIVSVIEQLPQNAGLRLVLAKYLRRFGADHDALSLMDQLPVQHRREVILTIEKFVLEVCVTLQDKPRAGLASTRLFELRLDPSDVAFIAEQLDKVGLTDTARRFTARIPPAPAGRAEGLHRLMQQYFDDGQSAAAARIAKQFILQPSVALDNSSVAASVQFRRDAMKILAECQAVRPVIRQLQVRLTDQLASVHQRHLLVELLRLDGRPAEAEEIAQSLRQSLIGDPNGGLQLARQLERQGRLESACDVCRYLLEADTSLFHRDYYRFIRLFERNGRLHELADLVMSIDLGENSHGHWGVQQLAERLLPLDESRGLQLFTTAWDAWPAARPALLSNVPHEAIWRLSRVFDYYRVRMLPSEDTRVDPWFGIAEHLQVRGRGIVTGTLSQMLQVPIMEENTVDFLSEIQRALEIQPDWHAGWIYAALLEAHLGHTDKAFTRLSQLLNQHAEEMPPMVAWITASELHQIHADPLDAIVVDLLEHLVDLQNSGTVLLKSGTVWHAAPDYLLTQYYASSGHSELLESAIDRMLTAAIEQPSGSTHKRTPESLADFDELADLLEPHYQMIAKRLREAGRSGLQATTDLTFSVPGTRAVETNPVVQAIRARLFRFGQ